MSCAYRGRASASPGDPVGETLNPELGYDHQVPSVQSAFREEEICSFRKGTGSAMSRFAEAGLRRPGSMTWSRNCWQSRTGDRDVFPRFSVHGGVPQFA